MRATTPPATPSDMRAVEESDKSAFLMMGFPSRIIDVGPTLCACHSQPTRGGYLCSRCRSKVCALPTTCPACGLTLILSTHLARSYHHLFPLRNWKVVSWMRAAKKLREQQCCFGCLGPFPLIPKAIDGTRVRHADGHQSRKGDRSARDERKRGEKETEINVSESGRYECENCGRFFCIECDVFAHEVVHNCPGCQSREGELVKRMAADAMVG